MERNDKQNLFVLTRDVVEISALNDFPHFICPLPRDYKTIIKRINCFEKECGQIADKINLNAEKLNSPFEGILQEYGDRTKKEKEKLLKNFKITRVGIDSCGVYCVQAGNDCNSGDIYLNSTCSFLSLNPQFKHLEQFFEEDTAFCCHNIDYHWQALLTSEFCIEYFNFLNNQKSNSKLP